MINWLISEIHQIRFAICFLTLLPFGSRKTAPEKTWARSVKYFTLVGYIFAFVNIFWFLLLPRIGFNLEEHKSIFALIIILSNLFLSGGLHLDGLMDSFDGVAASKPSRQETLSVMKDSRAGAFAVMAAIVAILSSWVLLSSFDYQNDYLFIILFLIPISSRFLMILVLFFQVSKEQALSEGSSLKAFKEHSKLTIDLGINLIFFLVALFLVQGFNLQVFFLKYFILLFSSYIFALWLKAKLQGHNGDSLGATLVITELILLLSCL